MTSVQRKRLVSILVAAVVLAVVAGSGYLLFRKPIIYAQAVRLFERGEYEKARAAFCYVGPYRDAITQAAVAEDYVVFQQVQEFMTAGNLEAAGSYLETQHPGEDPLKIVEAMQAQWYDMGLEALRVDDYTLARDFFVLCGDFQDAPYYVGLLDYYIQNGRFPTRPPTPTPILPSATPTPSPTPSPTPKPTAKPTASPTPESNATPTTSPYPTQPE